MKDSSVISLFKRLWSHISGPRRRQCVALLALMVLAALTEVVGIGAVLPFLAVFMAPESVFSNPLVEPLVKALDLTNANQLLLPLTMVFVLAAIVSGGMRIALLWTQTRLGFAIGADLSVRIYKNTLYQPYAVHINRNSSEMIVAISAKTNEVIYSTLLPLLVIISASLILLAILAVLVAVDPIVALAAFGGFGLIYSLIVLFAKRRLAWDSQRISLESNKVIKALQEGLGGIRDVLIDGSQEVYCKIYRDADLPLRRSQASIQIIAAAPRFIIESSGMVLIAILAYQLSGRETGIASAIPVLGTLAIGAQRMLPVLQQIYSSWSNIRGSRRSLQDVLDLLDQPLLESQDGLPLCFTQSIKLERLRFNYADLGPMVLDGINLEISKGSRVGFIGATGSGKSTLLDLIMGLLEPTEGCLTVDGVKIGMNNHRIWQKHIAHVPQAIFLADTTIAENIAFGVRSEEIDHQRVRNAAQKAQLAETIDSWDLKYETRVGERGVRLSGGQRQRIGIARAFYKNADVIVLDEATSALDNDTERAVMDVIDNVSSGVTVLIVAHRLTTLKNCDLIVELENGCIRRTGSYQDIVHAERKHLTL